MIRFAIIISALAMLTACEVQPSEVSRSQADSTMKLITYAKDDRTDICFAIIAMRKAFNTDQNGVGITQVPCEKVNSFLNK